MTLASAEVQIKIAEWQTELRQLTGADDVILMAYSPIKVAPPDTLKPLDEIIKIVCDVTGLEFSEIKKKGRRRDRVVARHLIVYYGRICAGLSHTKISEVVGFKDHSTSIHAMQTIQNLLDAHDADICRLVARINKQFEKAQA